jgi:methionyl-tRNA formyltransferase
MDRVFLLGDKAQKLRVKSCFSSVEPITVADIERYKPTHIICYGYRHIIKKDVIAAMPPNTIINLHPSFLPWGRGAHPNYWAWKNGEPHGITIHAVDAGLDTGPIFVQRQVGFFNYQDATLADTYNVLDEYMVQFFDAHIDHILRGEIEPMKQIGRGSYHRVSDLPELKDGWNTKISEIVKETI